MGHQTRQLIVTCALFGVLCLSHARMTSGLLHGQDRSPQTHESASPLVTVRSQQPPSEYLSPQEFASKRDKLLPIRPGVFVCEAEEFRYGEHPEGWRSRRFGENLYAATFANCFLSRQAFLGASAESVGATATMALQVETAGRYLALIRYEAAFRFETRFRLQIVQHERVLLDRVYGARDGDKIWPFGERIKKEVGWSWGATENIVWEGHDAFVELSPGVVELRLITEDQPTPATGRHIDLVMLTSEIEQVQQRIAKENYLPLDGLLTQQGDVWLEVTNRGDRALSFTGIAAPGGGNWQEHSPYWVHQRDWRVPVLTIEPRATSERVEVGNLMDSLSGGQWSWIGDQPYEAHFLLKLADGAFTTLGRFEGNGELRLAAVGDTRYSKRLRRREDVLSELLSELQQVAVGLGAPPQRTPIYALTFEPIGQPDYDAQVIQFRELFGIRDENPMTTSDFGMIDVRSIPTEKLVEYCQGLGEGAKRVRHVSLGDEIALPQPSGNQVDEEYRRWLQQQQVDLKQLLPNGAGDWEQIRYRVDETTRAQQVELYVWSCRYRNAYGIAEIKKRTELLRAHLPNATIGANYSPHYPQEHLYLGEVHKWVTLFREQGMTLPWSEDYIWQVPVGSPQMNHINLDLFRAGIRHQPQRPIMYYVMPHMPNNTPRQWRRLFHGAIGHGMTSVNLFEFRPLHVAYTENHVDDPAMYREVLRSFRELARYEDIVQEGQIPQAQVALWFSETADLWHDNSGSMAAAKRSLYTAIRHLQLPLDFVVEQDALDGTLDQYQVLYLTDPHVSQQAGEAIAKWVEAGGELIVTAGAGMFDEFDRPHQTLRSLMGVDLEELLIDREHSITWIKQDLPFASSIASLKLDEASTAGVFGARAILSPASADIMLHFSDGKPAICERIVGSGRVTTLAFLPGLSYYSPAIPKRPIDRGATDDAMIHLIPSAFDERIRELIKPRRNDLKRALVCSNDLVETMSITSPRGTIVSVVNWSGEPIESCKLQVPSEWSNHTITLASGRTITMSQENDAIELTFALDAAEVLIVRAKD